MNNLLSYCGIVEVKIRADKDFPVHSFVLIFCDLQYYDDYLWLFLDDDKWNLTMVGAGTSGNMAISVECQFLLTLAILRRDFDYLEAAQIFGLEAKTSISNQAYRIVSKIFKTWLIFIYRKFRLVLYLLIFFGRNLYFWLR